jgi:alpha-maltose-1-phosphate synthase
MSVDGRDPRVIVANPGGQRHLREVAAAFAEAGQLETYVSSFGYGPDEIERIGARLPGPVAAKVTTELKRRVVAPEVAERGVRVGSAWELANVALSRAPLPERMRIGVLWPTYVAFDRGVRRRLSERTSAVIGYQGATAGTFRRARERGIGTVLDYPIAHYEFTERVLTEEAGLVPEYAGTMRVTTYPEWAKHRYVAEIANADRVIMVSEAHRETFAAAGVEPERTFIVPWYVDSELFTPPDEPDESTFRVAFLGQIGQRKGLSYLVDGFRQAGLEDSELVLIGQPMGLERPWEGLPGVRHVPAMPNFRLPEVLRTCHVIALPSLVEGFPISVLEGMACGLPAIISENLGHDVVEDGVDGYVVPIRDPEAIADRLERLHADRGLWERMSKAARAKAETFTRERNHEALRKGVADLVAEKAG